MVVKVGTTISVLLYVVAPCLEAATRDVLQERSVFRNFAKFTPVPESLF